MPGVSVYLFFRYQYWGGKRNICSPAPNNTTGRGDGDVVSGWKNKLQSAIANITPSGLLAEQHRKMAEPGSDEK